ncbi:MAG: MFS transporter [Desulfobulbus propionicus]|nr:MAG: MFS transporter [Desulfobulbus propionicus]
MASEQNTSPEPISAPFQFSKVLLLSFSHFIHDVYSSFLAPLLPLLIEKLSLSLTQAGFLTTIVQIPSLVNPYLGALADRLNVRLFIIIAPGITALTMSLIGVADNYATLLFLLFIAGCSTAIYHVPAPVLMYRFAGSRKGLGMSFFMTGGELARAAGPIIAVSAVALVGLEHIYPIMLAGLLTSLLLYHQFKHIPPSPLKKEPPSLRAAWSSASHVLRPITGILLFRGFMHACIGTFLPTFINQNTGNLWLAGLSLAVYETSGVCGALTCGFLSDKIGRRTTLLLSLVLAPPLLFLFLLTDQTWLQILFLIGVGFTVLSTTPVMLALVQENAGDNPATVNGFFMMISFMSRSAVVVVVGAIADAIGLEKTYYLGAALGVLALPFILSLPKDQKE